MPRSSLASSTLRFAARVALGFTRGLGADGEALFKRFLRFVVTDCTADERALLEAGVVPAGLSCRYRMNRQRSGCCDYCYQFDTTENKLTNDIVREFHARMHDLQPGCMQAWDEHVANDKEFTEVVYFKAGSPRYLQELFEWARRQSERHVHLGVLTNAFEACFNQPPKLRW